MGRGMIVESENFLILFGLYIQGWEDFHDGRRGRGGAGIYDGGGGIGVGMPEICRLMLDWCLTVNYIELNSLRGQTGIMDKIAS